MQLHVADLACRRGGRLILAGVSFGLGAGDALLVTGRNGAGKSTLLLALAGLIRPAGGTVTLAGAGEAGLRESVHLLAARDALKAQLTTEENLLFATSCLGAASSPPEAALARVGLGRASGLPAAFLSSGQRRRLALARLLVAHRPVWLLDEPANALDDDGRALLATLVAEHRGAGGIVVAASHLPLAISGALELRLGQAGVAAA